MEKKKAVLCILLLAAACAFAQSGKEFVAKAQEVYRTDSFEKALAVVSEAVPEGSTDVALKSAAADVLTDISIKEYDAKNWKNAYDGLRRALKYSPTNVRATQYFLKIRRERDVSKLVNEGAPRQAQLGTAAAGTGTAAAAASAGTAAAAGTGTGAAAASAGTAAAASAGTAAAAGTPGGSSASVEAYQQALEKLVSTEQELQQIKQSTTNVSNENAALKAQLEQQKQDAQKQLEDIRQSAMATSSESQTLKEQMGQYKAVIDRLETRVQLASQAGGQDSKALIQMLDLYRKSLETQASAEREGTQFLSAQLAEQNRIVQAQFQSLSFRNLILMGGLGLLALLILFFVFVIVRAMARRRQAMETSTSPARKAFGAEQAEQERSRLTGGESLLLDFFPGQGKAAESEQEAEESGMYRDLLRAERIRRMHEQVKQGSLKWETVREYMGELEKDLRVEILKVVDHRLQDPDGMDPRAVLAVLAPFLTEHDDYLREKAESLVRESLGAGRRAARGLLPGGEGAVSEEDDSPLGIKKLMEITEKLRLILKDREKSTATARVARAMARVLGMSAADQEMVFKAALAHDVGYLLLDEDRLKRILGKPVLSEEDFSLIRSHARKGLEYFKGVKLPDPIKGALLSHHERNDGSGYPKGLKGDAIPLFAKIIGVAETYVALTSTRPYREKLSYEAAIAVIRDGVGRRFDREHVDALAEAMRRIGEP